MKNFKMLFIALCFTSFHLHAQQVFMQKGKITFEKKVNMIREMENWGAPDEIKEKVNKYRTSNWNLFFDDTQSLYKNEPKKDEDDNSMFFFINEQTSEMYTNLEQNKRVFRKSILHDEYIFKDSIPKLDWKILPELRTIAGYECRKALTKINDTVYVVAFYTEQILFKGGPEGFTGLPGTILGLAIPRFNTTWFATKVQFTNPKPEELTPPIKGLKAEDEKAYKNLIKIFTRYEDKKKPQKPEDIRKLLYGLIL